MPGQFLLDDPTGRGLDEQYVFQQVSHAGLAVTFVAGSHQIGHVDGHFRVGWIGEQQNAQSVGKVVFGDAFHGHAFLNPVWHYL